MSTKDKTFLMVIGAKELAYYATFSNFYKTCPSTLCFVQYYLSSCIAMSFLEKTTSLKRFVVHTSIMYHVWMRLKKWFFLPIMLFPFFYQLKSTITNYKIQLQIVTFWVIVHQNVVLGYVLIYQNLSLIFVHEEPNT